MANHLRELAEAQKTGKAVGITSICSAHPLVLRAAIEHARDSGRRLCVESTGRQVNQDGGYAGMTPSEFARYVRQTAKDAGLEEDQMILGGDHLGPGAWQSENSAAAMAKAGELVRQCVDAGYRKIHLDPSMPCKDDVQNGRPGLSFQTIAQRTALLCEIAENAAAAYGPGEENRLTYVVGAEVPVPGGVHTGEKQIRISSTGDVEETIRTMRDAFTKKGLAHAWDRCIAVVVETGATFGPEKIYDYDKNKTRDLKLFIETKKNLVLEAHSTDFQTRAALTDMVRDHFAILKVGPCLTFAAREALFALAYIEKQCLEGRKEVTLSHLPDVMEALMRKNPSLWQGYYQGSDAYLKYVTLCGFSDRIRYYWSLPAAREAVARLSDNLKRYAIPLPLLSQYLPCQFKAVREGRLKPAPRQIVNHKIKEVLNTYADACCGCL